MAHHNQSLEQIHQTERIDRIENQTKENNEKIEQGVSITSLFRFATKFDILLMVLGSTAALAMGCAMPIFSLLWGNITDTFGTGGDTMVEAAKNVMFQFLYIGAAVFVVGWAMFACWMVAGQRQAIACRKQYFKSLLKQQIAWFDLIDQSQLSSKFATDSFSFQGAIGQNVSTVLMTSGMFISGFVIAFVKGWLMTLVMLVSLPCIAITGYFFMLSIQNKEKALQKNYSKAGGRAEQAISSIKTVKQLNGEEFESDHYKSALATATSKSLRYAIISGIGIGATFCVMLFSYALGFWYGSICVEGGSGCSASINGGNLYTAGNVLIVFFSILMAGFNLSQLTPSLAKIARGRGAAARIFKIIDRVPLIKSKQNAIVPTEFKGRIQFINVTFAYPKDPSENILTNLSLSINYNNTAFVGESGCGKSTIFQLLMRFYDPQQGVITLDGVDMRDLDLVWLRTQLGYVGQQPVLFATTIRQNLLFGKEDATEEEIKDALIKAEAYDFVMNQLQQKLETYVGTGGGQISGGQKQRIAIARALLKNPKILLLDEATSALDRRNEKLIQQTLNRISAEKMTITIAHRVRTIMNADQIFVLNKGGIAESGKFAQLQRYQGLNIEEQDADKEAIGEQAAEAGGKPHAQNGMLDLVDPVTFPRDTGEVALAKEQKEKKEEEELVKQYEEKIFSRLFSYGSGDKLVFTIGSIVAIINGFIFPVFSIFLAKMLGILINFQTNPVQARSDANLYSLIFFLLGIASFFTNTLQMSLFSIVGEHITKKIREETYHKILKMPVPWFDIPRNNSGALAARLASDCQSVNGLTTVYVAIILQNLSTLLSAIGIALYYQWRTTLVSLGLIPFMLVAGAIQMSFMSGFSDKNDTVYKGSSSIITEAMVNIRTVTSFGYQDMVLNKYSQRLVEPMNNAVKKGNISGLLFGLSQFIMFVVFALIFYFGTLFIKNNGVSVADVFTAIYAIVFAGMTAGNNSHFMPDVGKAKVAAASLFLILDSEDQDQIQAKNNSKMISKGIRGNISLRNVTFKYESRNVNVFTNMNLEIKQGQKVAFVGTSGCGKSTILQLLQCFYQPTSGEIFIDGIDIKDYDVHYLRSCFGVVSQEPILFNETILYNIKYNKADATEEQIRMAAIQSNFNPEDEKFDQENKENQLKKGKNENKKDNPAKKSTKENSQNEETEDKTSKEVGTGFDKNVGIKGSHISGGQKQRVAIARVLIRYPRILLLDEATSALDSANQRKVQDSLDKMMQGKTSINIAHRIDTIKNSDVVMVFEKGDIVEKGSYPELIAAKGYLFNLEQGIAFT